MAQFSLDRREQGFTLVELAIVLVIIGLIIAGVLVGQDMIKAATIRSTISQMEKYNVAVTAFRTKYNGLPGDLTTAANFGMETRSGANGHGDNDRLLEGCNVDNSAAPILSAGCETGLFWRDLSFAGLIPESFTTSTDASGVATVANMGDYFPRSKVRNAAYFLAYGYQGRNYYALVHPLIVSDAMFGGPSLGGSALTPQEAYAIDSKMDDGMPRTGQAIATRYWLNTPAPSEDGIAECVWDGMNPQVYYTSDPAFAVRPLCELRINAGF